ncbi:MAG TPA: YhgE/Pip domain-containing protein [Candidatus Aphodovivens avistercoris]|nr:YhgE/Pip domain-containing protein [Candidatus Aphodovivens avistercoris]
MGNVFRVFARDVKRVAKVPAAWLVALFLIVLPSLYTWFNVVGFWDPYGHTENLRICVVNEDAGAHDATLGDLDLGGQVVEQLRSDHQLGWDFTDRDQAMEAVESGKAYAAFVIPSDFSADVATLLSGDPEPPQLLYYVNEKTGPVGPKITDTGASTLDATINDAFVSQASVAVADAVDDGLATAQSQVETARDDAMRRLSQASDAMGAARDAVAGLSASADDAVAKADEARASLEDAKSRAAELSDALEDVSALTGEAGSGIAGLPLAFGGALDDASRLLSQSSTQANGAIAQTAAGVVAAQGGVEAALARADAVAQGNAQVLQELSRVCEGLPEGAAKDALAQAIEALERDNAQASDALEEMAGLSESLAATAESTSAAADSLDGAVQDALASADGLRGTLEAETIPSLGDALARISAASSELSGAVAAQQALIDQTLLSLDQLKGTLGTAQEALAGTEDVLGGLASDFETARVDIAALGSSDALADVFGGQIDSDAVADFMMSPTRVETEVLYPLNSYGSAMAPLFINLTLWIGAFMLMVIMRLEVDGEGVAGLTAAQRYLGRWLLLAVMAALQAAVCCVGCLVIGVQTASTALFFLTAVGASQAYLAIQYALSTLLQHVGKGLCVVLVFVQIPAATGLYPVEMTPAFFQAVYPAFPFTYGINAMRETIGGLYDGAWASDMAVLAAFFAVSMALGILLRPYLVNLNRMFAREIEESGIINGERVALPERRFRMAQLLRALSDKEEYRADMLRRAGRFLRWYPRMKTGALVVGIAVPVVAAVVLSVTQAEKVVLLTVWLVWLVAVIAFLVVIEHVRDELDRRAVLGSLDDDEVRTLYRGRGEEGAR